MYIYARPFLSMRRLSFSPICQLKRKQLCFFFNVWSLIILHLPYAALTSCNLWFWARWLVDPIPARLPVFFCRRAFKRRSVVCFCFYVPFFWTWRYPPIDGNNWGAVHFNECAAGRRAGAAGSERAKACLLYIWKDAGVRDRWKQPMKAWKVHMERAVFLKPWIIT